MSIEQQHTEENRVVIPKQVSFSKIKRINSDRQSEILSSSITNSVTKDNSNSRMHNAYNDNSSDKKMKVGSKYNKLNSNNRLKSAFLDSEDKENKKRDRLSRDLPSEIDETMEETSNFNGGKYSSIEGVSSTD